MTVAPRVRQPFQQDQAHSLGEAGAVGVGGEGFAAAVGGQTALAAEFDQGVGRGHHRHTTRQSHGALAIAQCLGRQVQGHQGRGARGVDTDRGALQPQGVGDTAGGHTPVTAIAQVPLKFLGDAAQPAAVVVVHDAGEDAGAASAQ